MNQSWLEHHLGGETSRQDSPTPLGRNSKCKRDSSPVLWRHSGFENTARWLATSTEVWGQPARWRMSCCGQNGSFRPTSAGQAVLGSPWQQRSAVRRFYAGEYTVGTMSVVPQWVGDICRAGPTTATNIPRALCLFPVTATCVCAVFGIPLPRDTSTAVSPFVPQIHTFSNLSLVASPRTLTTITIHKLVGLTLAHRLPLRLGRRL